jgi:hypothetical protein
MSSEAMFDHYRTEIIDLQEQYLASIRMPYSAGVSPDTRVSGYLGHGDEYVAIQLSDTTKVAKLAQCGWYYDEDKQRYHENNLVALERCIGAQQLEQMVAGTVEGPPAIVTEFIPGLHVAKEVGSGGLFRPSDFNSLFLALETLYEHNLQSDLSGGNILFSRTNGVANTRERPGLSRCMSYEIR